MKKLDEEGIIQTIQKSISKKFVPEDVEIFRIGKKYVVAKADTLVESTDIPPKMTISQATRKSIVACVSDFAAKGIQPQFGIISMIIPRKLSQIKIKQIASTMKNVSKEFGFKFLGGDTNEGKEIIFNVCLFGSANKIVRRSGAKKNDLIFVSGQFGYTGAGLEILLHKKKAGKNLASKAIRSVLHPSVRLEFGLKNARYFSSSMDSSDGLSTTLNELARQSKSKFVITKIPTRNEIKEFASKNKIRSDNLVFHSGEEYEIVFTTSRSNAEKIIKNAKNVSLIKIGYVTNGKGVEILENGRARKLEDHGWHHFSAC